VADFNEDDKKLLAIGGVSIFVGVGTAIVGGTGIMGREWIVYQILIGTALIALGAVLIWLPLRKSKAHKAEFVPPEHWHTIKCRQCNISYAQLDRRRYWMMQCPNGHGSYCSRCLAMSRCPRCGAALLDSIL
jgi:hypothetical protein